MVRLRARPATRGLVAVALPAPQSTLPARRPPRHPDPHGRTLPHLGLLLTFEDRPQ